MKIKYTFRKQLRGARLHGFTLVELLTVIAIIGILAGILIPVVGSARTSALRAKSKAQFNGYALAITAFRNEYGHYPTGLSDDPKNINESEDFDFVEILSGRDREDGKAVAKGGNRRAIAFYTFSNSEFLPNPDGTYNSDAPVVDAFENPNIMVVVDADNDGEVDTGDYGEQKVKVAVFIEKSSITSSDGREKGWQEVKSWD